MHPFRFLIGLAKKFCESTLEPVTSRDGPTSHMLMLNPTIPGRLFIFPIDLSYRWAERALLTTAG